MMTTMTIQTLARTTGAIVLGSGLALAQTPQTKPETRPQPRTQTEQPRSSGAQQDGQDRQKAMGEVVLQGCLARDDSASRPGATGARTTTAAGSGEVFLLKNVSKDDGAAGARSGNSPYGAEPTTPAKATTTPTGQQSGTHAEATQAIRGASDARNMGDATYRLRAGSESVNLAPQVGHQVEVRGRMAGDAAGEHGQTQRATPASQHGQGGQSTVTPAGTQAGQQRQAGRADAGALHAEPMGTVTVSSVRMISQSCGTSR